MRSRVQCYLSVGTAAVTKLAINLYRVSMIIVIAATALRCSGEYFLIICYHISTKTRFPHTESGPQRLVFIPDLACGEVPAPNNGVATCRQNSFRSNVCTFKCKRCHRLMGSRVRMCLNNALWSGTATKCTYGNYLLFEDIHERVCVATGIGVVVRLRINLVYLYYRTVEFIWYNST